MTDSRIRCSHAALKNLKTSASLHGASRVLRSLLAKNFMEVSLAKNFMEVSTVGI